MKTLRDRNRTRAEAIAEAERLLRLYSPTKTIGAPVQGAPAVLPPGEALQAFEVAARVGASSVRSTVPWFSLFAFFFRTQTLL